VDNYLGKLKKLVRSSHLPFRQVTGRLSEMNCTTTTSSFKNLPVCRYEHSDGPVTASCGNCGQYPVLETASYVIALSDKDNCVLLKNRILGVVRNILLRCGQVLLMLSVCDSATSLYECPLDSAEICI
jgi:hypothetical protein